MKADGIICIAFSRPECGRKRDEQTHTHNSESAQAQGKRNNVKLNSVVKWCEKPCTQHTTQLTHAMPNK